MYVRVTLMPWMTLNVGLHYLNCTVLLDSLLLCVSWASCSFQSMMNFNWLYSKISVTWWQPHHKAQFTVEADVIGMSCKNLFFGRSYCKQCCDGLLHDNVVSLCVGPWRCALWLNDRPTSYCKSVTSEQVNRKCRIRNTILQLSTPYTNPERQKTTPRIGMLVRKSCVTTNMHQKQTSVWNCIEYVRGIWTLVMFKASNLFSLLDTQLMKTVPGSFDTCF